MNGISVCSAKAEAYLAVLLLGMMEWISTKYHILSSGQKSCNGDNHVRHAGIHDSKAWLCPHMRATKTAQAAQVSRIPQLACP